MISIAPAGSFGYFRKSLFAIIVLLAATISSCRESEGNRLYDEAVDYWKSGYYDEALQTLIALTKSYSTHPLVDDSLFLTAGIYDFYLKEPKNAVRYYRILNKNFQDSKYYVYSMLNLADIYSAGSEEDKLKAIGIYDSLYQTGHSPDLSGSAYDSEYYLYNIAWLYIQLNNLTESRKFFKKLVVDYPDTPLAPHAFFMLGYTFVQDGMKRIAELTFKEAIEKMGPARATDSILGLGNLYEDMNQLDKALSNYTLASDNLPPDDSLHEVLQERIKLLKYRLTKIKR